MSERADKIIAVSWEDHRRTRGICDYFGIELHVLLTPRRGLRRYAELIPRTLRLLSKHRSHTVMVQNPSVVLALVAVFARPFLGLRIVMDAHNEAVEPYLNPAAPFRWVARRLHGWMDRVIVTNRYLADIITANGGRPIVLADPVPHVPELGSSVQLQGPFSVTFVSTFARDEPLTEVLSAAALVGPEFQFYVTGNDRKAPAEARSSAPANVHFTGFLSEADYWAVLARSDLIIDLTLIDNCLVCGAYEALAVGTPLVLSGNAASRDLFGAAACYTDNTASSIAEAVRNARQRLSELRGQGAVARDRLNSLWEQQAAHFRAALVMLAGGSSHPAGPSPV